MIKPLINKNKLKHHNWIKLVFLLKISLILYHQIKKNHQQEELINIKKSKVF